MTSLLQSKIDLLPLKPGVYLMKNKQGKVIYVGKAKNLKNRVSQYFLRPQMGKVRAMVTHVEVFDTIITENEKEALILEINLIQTYYPRYNIMLKDGSHYPYIALKNDENPYLYISRNTKDKKSTYFGPYPNSRSAREMLELLNKIFSLRKCKKIPHIACLYYHLGQCVAPCINKDASKYYDEITTSIIRFLGGNNQKERKEYEDKMKIASEKMEYEQALVYKDIVKAIDHINIKQATESSTDKLDRDIFATSLRDGYLSLAVILYRNGKLLGKELYVEEEFGELEEEVSSLINQFYQTHPIPKEVVINLNIDTSLQDTYGFKIVHPTRGKFLELVEIASKNAKQGLDDHFMTARLEDDNLKLLEELGSKLGIDTPLNIELFDNSHLQGSSPVGAMVSFINGVSCKKNYRKFNIEHDETRDDYASMKEVIYRRYKRVKENEGIFPDLIIVDGGDKQVRAAKESEDKLELNIPIYGLFKNEKHQTKGLCDDKGQVIDLSDYKDLFFLLIRMQDEVHRYAITFHKSKRSKALTKSIFDDIKGLGPSRIELINRNYESINELKNASEEELSQLLPSEVAKALFEKLKE